jgi:hypothetical protein
VKIAEPVVSYRYYRFRAIADQGGGYLDLSELAFWHNGSRVGGGSYTVGAGASVYNSLDGLGDGNVATRIFSVGAGSYNTTPSWEIKVDFGTPTAVSSWRQAVAEINTRGIANCTLEGSNNDSTWDAIQTFFGIASAGDTYTLRPHVVIKAPLPSVSFPARLPAGTIAFSDTRAFLCTATGSPGTWIELITTA